MDRASAKIARVIAEIEEEISNLRILAEEFQNLKEDNRFYLRIASSIFHDFYSGVEKIFKKIAEDLNGGLPNSDNWHKELLHEMSMEITELRPVVIQKDTEEKLLEFLKFRHLSRNNYGFSLKKEKMTHLFEAFPITLEQFSLELSSFIRWLKTLMK